MLARNKYIKVLSAVFLLGPLWWAAGLDLVIYTVVIIAGLAMWPQARKPDNWGVLMLALMTYLTLRLGFYLAWGGEVSRTVAAVSNIINMLVLWGGYQITRNASQLNNTYMFAPQLNKVFWFMAITTIAAITWGLKTGETALGFKTLLGMVTPPTDGLIGLYQNFRFFVVDWATGESLPRALVMAPYPTASAMLLAFMATASLLHNRQRSWTKRFALEILCLTALVFTMTRTILGGYILGTGLAIFLLGGVSVRVLFSCAAVLGLLVIWSAGFFDWLANFRTSSNNLRFQSYELAYRIVMDENPMFGLGVKPRDEIVMGIPIGSHSTFMSYLTKGGIIGFLLVIAVLLYLPKLILRAVQHVRQQNMEQKYIAFVLIRMGVVLLTWLPFADVDAVPLVALCVGMYLGWLKVLLAGFNTTATGVKQGA